jgi:uncharacterized protein
VNAKSSVAQPLAQSPKVMGSWCVQNGAKKNRAAPRKPAERAWYAVLIFARPKGTIAMNAEVHELEPLSSREGDTPPPESRVERLEAALAELRASVPEVIGAAVVSADGFLLASALPRDADAELVSAMAVALLGTGDRIAGEVLGGELTQALVRGRLGWLVLCAIGRDAALAALTTPSARVGLVLLEAKRRAAQLATIV